MSAEPAIEAFRGRQGLAAIRDDWDRLARSLETLRFFHLREWYESYLDTLERVEPTVEFLLMRRQGVPEALFPLRPGRRVISRVGVRTLEIPHGPHMQLTDFVFAQREDTRSAVRRLVRHLGVARAKWDVLVLPHLLEDSCAAFSLRACPPAFLCFENETHCDYLPSASPEELSRRLSKNFRGNLRKARNKLQKLEGLQFVSASGPEALRGVFEEFLEVEASGWKGGTGTGTAIRCDERVHRFYRTLIEKFAAVDGCAVHLLRAGGRCLAGQFCLSVGDTCYVLKIGYDEEYSSVAPGHLLLENVVTRAAQSGTIRAVNLVTDTAWHADWKPEMYAVSDAYVFNRTPRGLAAWLLTRAKQRYRRRRPERPPSHGAGREGAPDGDRG
jgi:CelD/BcsL family acetyltransferase involved in cellulose biosynthesis